MQPFIVASSCFRLRFIHQARAEILIGVAGPMTGKLAWIGEQMQRGAEMAVADINAAGGVLGQQVRLIAADDFCDPEQAVAAAQKLVRDGRSVRRRALLLRSIDPGIGDLRGRRSILQISPGSTNPMLTEQGRANVFRVIGRDDVQGIVAGNYLADHWGDKKIAILHDGTTYGKGLADETKKQMNKRGDDRSDLQSLCPRERATIRPKSLQLQAADIAVLYVGGYHTEVALMARAARDRGYSVQLISGDAMATEEFGLIAGPAAEGTLFTFVPDPRRNAEAAPVVERFRAENFEPQTPTRC